MITDIQSLFSSESGYAAGRIELPSGREMPFELKLAGDNPREKPILLQFHGWGAGGKLILETAKRRLKDWNLVRPMDRYGYVRNGCWWLGENHEFFYLDLIDQLLQHLRDDLAMTGDLYAYGSSMGGFGALLHGLRHKFKAISLNVPQVRLLGTEYLARREESRGILAAIWDESVIQHSWEDVVNICRDNPESSLRYSDATCFLDVDNPSDNPMIFISYLRFESKQYFADQCMYLLDRLVQTGCNFELFVEPRRGHYRVRKDGHAIKLFEEYRDVIESPLLGAPVNRNINVPPPPPRNHSVLCNQLQGRGLFLLLVSERADQPAPGSREQLTLFSKAA